MSQPTRAKASAKADPANMDAEKHHRHHAAYAAEASGLLIIALLLLAIVLIRYWHNIPWGAR